jgi:hypothetical protein
MFLSALLLTCIYIWAFVDLVWSGAQCHRIDISHVAFELSWIASLATVYRDAGYIRAAEVWTLAPPPREKLATNAKKTCSE